MGKIIGAGYDRIEYGVVDVSTGLVHGNTILGATAGSAVGQPMLRLRGAMNFPASIPEPEIVVPLGDNEPRTSFEFPAADITNGILELSDHDLAFDALAQGTKVETVGNYDVGGLGPKQSSKPTLAFLMYAETKKQDAGEVGVPGWEVLLIPRATVTPLYKDLQQRAHSPYRYKINVVPSDRSIIGYTFTEGVHGFIETDMLLADGNYPPHQDNYKGDSSRVAFTLQYTPVNPTAVKVAVAGVLQTYTTHYTVSGNTLTMLSAPASGAIVNALYEVAESDIL